VKAVIIANPRSDHQTQWGGAFASGLRRHGWTTEISPAAQACDLLVLWGVRQQSVIAAARADGIEVCIVERGYLGDRFKWSSVSFGGGLNGLGHFRGTSADPARLERNFPGVLQPWSLKDGYALLIGQVPGDMSLHGANMPRWYFETAADLMRAGYDVRFRAHPQAVERGYMLPTLPEGVSTIAGSLADAMAGAAQVVTFNSNTGVEAALAGIPLMAHDRRSMAWDVASHSVYARQTPDRQEWAARLAWKQFTLSEIASGFCWEIVGDTHAGQAVAIGQKG
jgi:hypothetical protein